MSQAMVMMLAGSVWTTIVMVVGIWIGSKGQHKLPRVRELFGFGAATMKDTELHGKPRADERRAQL